MRGPAGDGRRCHGTRNARRAAHHSVRRLPAVPAETDEVTEPRDGGERSWPVRRRRRIDGAR